MSGEDTCPICKGPLGGDQRCHNKECRASEEYWDGDRPVSKVAPPRRIEEPEAEKDEPLQTLQTPN